MKEELINKAYEIAKERYAALGLDVEKVMEQLQKVSISMHCWQADDVIGFESGGSLKMSRIRLCIRDGEVNMIIALLR